MNNPIYKISRPHAKYTTFSSEFNNLLSVITLSMSLLISLLVLMFFNAILVITILDSLVGRCL